MHSSLIFLLLIVVSNIPNSLAFNDINWNLQIFIGNPCGLLLTDKREFDIVNSVSAPRILYFLNASGITHLEPFKRPVYSKSLNIISTYIVMEKLSNILSTSQHLERILTPLNHPIVVKDNEKVVFHLIDWNESQVHEILKSFGKKLKYKLALSFSSQKEPKSPVTFGSCEFCKQEYKIFPSKPDWKDYERNFGGTGLKITTPTSARPRLNYTLGPDGKYRIVNGLLVYVLHYMQEKLNFTINLKPASRGGGTGIKLPNGTWTGIMSEVLSGEADIGMCTAETYSRTRVAGFTPAVIIEPVTFVSGPPHKIFVWNAIFWPFRSEVWSFLAGIILFSVIMIRLSFAALKIPRKKIWASNKVLGFILGILLGNCGRVPAGMPFTIKFYAALWLLCGSIITTAYLSKLVGFLTFPLFERVPQNAEELANSEYSWGLTYFGGAVYSLIKASKTKTYEKILSKMELNTDIIGCLTRTLDTKYICISYETIPQFYLNSRVDIKPGHSPLEISKNYFLTVPVGIVMEKGAVFGPNLNSAIRSLDSAGLNYIWEKLDFRKIRQGILEKKKAEPKPPDHDINKEEDRSSLTLQHMQGAFTVFVTGLSVAWIIFSWEKLCRSKRNRSKMIDKV